MKTARPSQEQVKAIVDFMETHPVLGLGRAKGWKERVEMRKLRSQITTVLNSLDGPTRSAESWMKFWSDKKLAVRQKVLVADGDLEICTDIEKKIWNLFLSNTEPVVRRPSAKEPMDDTQEDINFEPESVTMEMTQDNVTYHDQDVDAVGHKENLTRPSEEQMTAIIEYMEKNPNLAIGKVTNWQDIKMWTQLMRKLNTLPGSVKPLKSWMKYWSDKKCVVREKIMTGADSYNLCSDIDKKIWDLILEHCVEFHSPRPSQEQVMAIVSFMERHRAFGVGNARSLKAKEERKRLWTQLIRKVNTLPGPTRSLKSWVKYWNDKKSAVRNKVMSGENSYMYCTEVEKKIWDLFLADEHSRLTQKNNLMRNTRSSSSQLQNYDADDRVEKPTSEQQLCMIEFMEQNPILVSRKGPKSEYMSEVWSLWPQLAKTLNSLPGSSRTVKSWMKSWHDKKHSVRKKMKSGDEGYSQSTDVERRIWDLLAECDKSTEDSQESIAEERDQSNGLEEIYLAEDGEVEMEEETEAPQAIESDDEVLANKKWPFPSEEQIEAIVNFMEKHPALGKGGRWGKLKDSSKPKRLWKQIAKKLNELPGPTRTVKVWMKYWYSKKRTIRQKVKASGTPDLCDHEQRIWNLFLADETRKSPRNPIKEEVEENLDNLVGDDVTENQDGAESSSDGDDGRNDVMSKALELISSQTSAMQEMARAASCNAQALVRLAEAAQTQARAMEQLSSSFTSITTTAAKIQNSLDNIDETMKRFCTNWQYPDR